MDVSKARVGSETTSFFCALTITPVPPSVIK